MLGGFKNDRFKNLRLLKCSIVGKITVFASAHAVGTKKDGGNIAFSLLVCFIKQLQHCKPRKGNSSHCERNHSSRVW